MEKVVEPITVGVDLGGTKIETDLVDGSGKVLASHRHPTHPEAGSQKVISTIVSCVKECLPEEASKAKGLGIGVAGQVDRDTGIVRFAPNLDWRDVPLQSELENALGFPVSATNDVRAATWGEWLHGAGKGEENLVVLFVGTGIGGGIVSNGRMVEGGSNTAGELGHLTLVINGRRCHCPNRGCLEAYAGGWALAVRAQDAVRATPKAGHVLVSLAGGIEKITAVHVSQAYSFGDPVASHLVEETGDYLAAGVVSIVNALNPSLLVLGGGVIEGLPDLVNIVEKTVRKHGLAASVENLRVVKAALGEKAGSIGAAAFARDSVSGG